MELRPQAREKARALVGAASLGSLVGLAIGGAYLAGGLARVTVVHAEIQKLAGAASGGFSESALKASTGQGDAAVLAIAQMHDPYSADPAEERDRQVAALVERLEARRAARGAGREVLFASSEADAQRQKAREAQVVRVAAAKPFHLRGALDQTRDLECLTQAIYFEARGESTSGQRAVAQVILNRVRAPSFPKTVCGVVYQGVATGSCQFSFACSPQARRPSENAAWRRSESIAAEALGGQVMAEVGDATHFHTATGRRSWSAGLMKVAQIGAHVFYRFSRHGEAREAPAPSDAPPRPLFASLSLAPGGDGPPSPPARLIASASAAVEHAASVVESAAKQVTAKPVTGGDARPATSEPAQAPKTPAEPGKAAGGGPA